VGVCFRVRWCGAGTGTAVAVTRRKGACCHTAKRGSPSSFLSSFLPSSYPGKLSFLFTKEPLLQEQPSASSQLSLHRCAVINSASANC
jgi:hypothetical protein